MHVMLAVFQSCIAYLGQLLEDRNRLVNVNQITLLAVRFAVFRVCSSGTTGSVSQYILGSKVMILSGLQT